MSIRSNTQSRFMILYHENVDIDGFNCRREFSQLIRKTGRKHFYKRAHEWCCGHGAIGFQLLEDGLCQHLVLTDKFSMATQDCKYTVAANDLEDSVTVYNHDSLGHLPPSEKWDLFVANPPWRKEVLPGPDLTDDLLRKMFDIDWVTHDDMWDNISRYLTHDADIYIYEDSRFSDAETWTSGYTKAGLELVAVHRDFGIIPSGYVLQFKKLDI